MNKRDRIQEKIFDNISSSFVNNIITELHSNAGNQLTNQYNDIYSELSDLGYNLSKGRYLSGVNSKKDNDASFAIKILFKKILENYRAEKDIYVKNYINQQIIKLGLKSTANGKIMVNGESSFYYLNNNYEFCEDKSILKVYSDGSYDKKSRIYEGKGDYIVKTYNDKDEIIRIKLLNRMDYIYSNKEQVAKNLKLKKELVKKYTLRGYPGESVNFFSVLCNKLFKPIESGFYMDCKYNFYKWNYEKHEFERIIRSGRTAGSPLLSDFDIKENVVIRTNYDGNGLVLQ